MKKVIINPAFGLTPIEIEALSSLPAHTPEWQLTAANERLIGNIFYRVFGLLPIASDLLSVEKKQRWATGQPTKNIDAQMHLLTALKYLSHYTGLHDTVSPEYLLNQLATARNGVLKLLPVALTVIDEPMAVDKPMAG